jgi:hypothetical protein
MPVLTGSCHCGAHKVELDSRLEPEALEVRACQCSFCRTHGALSISDPAGSLTYRVSPAALSTYRFGLRLADFLVCTYCGAYLGAYMEEAGRAYGVLNLNVLEARGRFGTARPMNYDGEGEAQRLARRRERWTPAARIDVEPPG